MPLDRITASSRIGSAGMPIRIHSVVLKAGSDAALADIADQETASGDSKIPLSAATANTIDRAIYGADGPKLTTAGYLTISGTSAVAVVHWEKVLGAS